MKNKKTALNTITEVNIKIYENADGTRKMVYKFEPPLNEDNDLGQEILTKLRMIGYERRPKI